MADEPIVTEGGAPAADTTPEVPQGEVREPRNVREAIAQRRAAGDPGFVEITEEAAHKPYSDATLTDDDEILLEEPPAATTTTPPPATAPVAAPPADPYAEFGGRTQVEDAIVLSQALRTESGVRTLAAQTLQALGYTPEAVQAFLTNQQAPAAPVEAPDPFAGLGDIADDDVVTGADVKKLLTAAVQQITSQVGEQFTQQQQAAITPLQEQIQQDRQRNATRAVDSTLNELIPGIENNTPTDEQRAVIADVQNFAAKYLEPDNWDPQHISYALRRGHADMVARDQQRVQAYIASKRAARAAAPANINGGSAGGEELPEPKNVKEAIAQRKKLGIL